MWEFDTRFFLIFSIPSYIFFAGLGIMVSLSVFPILLLKGNEKVDIYMPRLLISFLGIILGAKFLGIIVCMLNALQQRKNINKDIIIQSGIVYYGGLFGLIICFFFMCKFKNKNKPKRVFDSLAVVIPLFHVFGRIGCFTSGCCYGSEMETPISVLYTTSIDNEVVTAIRIPTQLIESGLNAILFFCLLVIYLKGFMQGKLIYIYLTSYAIIRFFLEFIRGDINRGLFLGISTSQIISLFTIIAIIFKFINEEGLQKWVDF